MKNNFLLDYANLPYRQDGDESDINRMNWRCELLLTRNKQLIENQRVLDLACNNGRLSYPCLALGAKQVTGVEARQELIDLGKEYLQGSEYLEKMNFVKADLFEYLASVKKGEFDVINCFGFLYHTTRQVDFFREVKRIAPKHVIIDTSVSKNYFWFGKSGLSKPPSLLMITENPQETRNTTDLDGIAFWPTKSFLETMFELSGYNYQQIHFSKNEITNWTGMRDYKKEYRISYVAHLIN